MASSKQPCPPDAIWTPANIVTLVRICLVPVFVVALISPWPDYMVYWPEAHIWKPWVAAGIFVLLACTDGVDGYLARSRNEVTDFGKFMDPLADKILVAAALLALVELQVLPSWVALIILTREFIVSGIRMIAATKNVVIAASWYGKAKTVSQIIAIVLFIIKDSLVFQTYAAAITNPLYMVSWLAMLVALALTIISMVDYFAKSRELLGFGSSKRAQDPHSLPELDQELINEMRIKSARIIEAAKKENLTICSAESLTGGMITEALTSVPGSSSVVRGGIVSYVNDIKHEVLGVDNEVLNTYGAVSKLTVAQMALGAKSSLACDISVAVSGIAGPGGEEPDKPVGTVWFAISSPLRTITEKHQFKGDRNAVRELTVITALDLVFAELQQIESQKESNA